MKLRTTLRLARGPLVFGALGLVALVWLWSGHSARAADESGGWDAMQMGFASRARVAAGTNVSIEVVAMGNSRGIVVTYSGNPELDAPRRAEAHGNSYRLFYASGRVVSVEVRPAK